MQTLFVEDISTVIFEKYLGLLQKAIAEDDLATIEDYWQKSLRLGSRGLVIRTVINKSSKRLIENFVQPNERHPLWHTAKHLLKNYAALKTLQKAKEILDLLNKDRYRTITPLLADPEYAKAFLLLPFGFYRGTEKLSTQVMANYIYAYLLASLRINQFDQQKLKDLIGQYRGWYRGDNYLIKEIKVELAEILKRQKDDQPVRSLAEQVLGKLPEV